MPNNLLDLDHDLNLEKELSNQELQKLLAKTFKEMNQPHYWENCYENCSYYKNQLNKEKRKQMKLNRRRMEHRRRMEQRRMEQEQMIQRDMEWVKQKIQNRRKVENSLPVWKQMWMNR